MDGYVIQLDVSIIFYNNRKNLMSDILFGHENKLF
jgi:hypothetical protein